MEIQKITYENKEYIRNDPQYPETETVTDGNMNEIKKVVNNNADKQDEDYLKLKNALINAETEEAKSLHVTDANKFGQLEILGNHEQETREGYNILDYLSYIRSSTNGLTINKDEETGYITVNGTPTSNYISIITGFSDITDLLEDGQTYTMWQENHSEGDLGGIYLQIIRSNKDDGGNAQYWTSSTDNYTFTVDKSLYKYAANIQTGSISQAGTFNNYRNRYMIYKGTDEKEFELYGASPSPDYPSKVVCLGSNVKNIFTETNVLSDVYLNNFDEIVENQDYVMYYFEVEPNQNYVLSFKYTQNLVELGKIGYGFSDSVPFIGQELEAEDTYSIFGNKVNGKVIIPSKKYLIFNFMKSMYNTMYDIQLEKGTEATSYSPPGQGSTKIKKDNGLHNIQVEQGSLNSSTGTIINADTRLRTADFVEIKNFNKIDCKGMTTCNVFFYDTNKTYLGRASTSWETLPFQFEILQNAVYLKAIFRKDDEVVTPDMIKNLRLYSEETDYLLYIQQEMLSGDYFVKEADGWKEVHNFGKYVFDGTENYIKSPLSDDDYLKTYANTAIISTEEIKFDGKMFATRYKNIGIYSSSTTDNRIACRSQLHTQISTEFLTENTAEAYKALLAEWKNEGKPLAVFYELINQIKLACTEAQSAVLEELNNLSLFNGVNNIITAEDIALLKLKYALNAKIYIDNLLTKQSESTVAEEV